MMSELPTDGGNKCQEYSIGVVDKVNDKGEKVTQRSGSTQQLRGKRNRITIGQ